METYGYNNPENNNPQQNFNNNQFYQSDKKLAAGLLAIFLGCFGVHKFYLGYNQEGAMHIPEIG